MPTATTAPVPGVRVPYDARLELRLVDVRLSKAEAALFAAATRLADARGLIMLEHASREPSAAALRHLAGERDEAERDVIRAASRIRELRERRSLVMGAGTGPCQPETPHTKD